MYVHTYIHPCVTTHITTVSHITINQNITGLIVTFFSLDEKRRAWHIRYRHCLAYPNPVLEAGRQAGRQASTLQLNKI